MIGMIMYEYACPGSRSPVQWKEKTRSWATSWISTISESEGSFLKLTTQRRQERNENLILKKRERDAKEKVKAEKAAAEKKRLLPLTTAMVKAGVIKDHANW